MRLRQLPDADPGTPDGRSAARYLRWLVRHSWRSVYAAIAFAVVWMLCQAAIPALVGKAIDAVTAGDGQGLLTWSAVLFAAGTGQAFAGIVRHRFAGMNH